MAQFSVKKNNIDSVINTEEDLAQKLSGLENEIRSVSNSLGFSLASSANIRGRLKGTADNVSAHRATMNNMRSALQNTMNVYERTENAIIGNLNVGKAKTHNEENAKPPNLDLLWKGIGAFGSVGKVVSAVGKFATGDKGSAVTWVKGVSDSWKAGWKIADTVKTCNKHTDIQWWKAALGLNKNSFLKNISESGLSWQQKAMHGWDKGIKGTIREFKKTDGFIKQSVGIGLSLAVNGFSNYDEYKTGGITAKRAVAETITETAVDWGKDLLIGAAVTAGFAAAGFAAPVVVVGAATVAVSVGADWVCKQVTGALTGEEKGLTETVSDFVLDTAEKGIELIETGAKKVAEGASALWSNVKQGASDLTSKWRFPKFAWN